MRKLLILISLILVIFSFNGCGNKVNSDENVSEKEVLPYEKLTLINEINNRINREWTDKLRMQLIEKQEVSEMTADRLLKNGIFGAYKLEIADNQEYDSKTYPYKISANLVIWQCDGYYTICEIKNKKLESYDKNVEVIMEEPLEMWTDDLEILKIVPANSVIKFDMGGSASFKEKENKEIGPFTIVYRVNFSCPSAQIY